LTAIVAQGTDIAYNIQPNTVSITATTAAGAQQVVAASAITFDGSPIWVELGCTYVYPPNATTALTITLWDASTDLGTLAGVYSVGGIPVFARRRLVPAAGSHTYSIRAYLAAAGTGGLQASATTPTYLRISRA